MDETSHVRCARNDTTNSKLLATAHCVTLKISGTMSDSIT